VSPVTDRLHERFPDADVAVIAEANGGADAGLDALPATAAAPGLNAAIDTVRASVDGRIDSVLVIPRKAAWGIRSIDPRDIDDFGRLWTYVSMKDGAILGQRHDNG